MGSLIFVAMLVAGMDCVLNRGRISRKAAHAVWRLTLACHVWDFFRWTAKIAGLFFWHRTGASTLWDKFVASTGKATQVIRRRKKLIAASTEAAVTRRPWQKTTTSRKPDVSSDIPRELDPNFAFTSLVEENLDPSPFDL